MKATDAIEVIDRMIEDTARQACQAAATISTFDDIGAGSGVGIRLRALNDARNEIVCAGLRELEGRPQLESGVRALTIQVEERVR